MTDHHDDERLGVTDDFEGEHMVTSGQVLLRDKLTTRPMAGVLGGAALVALAFSLFQLFALPAEAMVAPAATVVAALFLALAAVTLTVVRTVVTSDEVMVRLGLWGPRVPIADVVSVRAIDYPMIKYGGWGIKRGIDGSWAYTIPGGTGRVVELEYRDGSKTKKVVFSAERPEAVAEAILRATSGRLRIEDVSGAGRSSEVQADHEALIEAEAEAEAAGAARPKAGAEIPD
ncbi:MAG TPA: hypothetical protein ENK57_14615 [Polyangiaceae bacterium]|nr:hypothetical protein [Polyangiaceae bacterium]